MAQDLDAYETFQAMHPGFGVEPADEEVAPEIVEWVMDRATASDRNATFYRDLAAALQAAEVPGSSFALVCSAVAAFRHNRDHHVSDAHIGEVGTRAVFSLTLKRSIAVRHKKRKYGTSYRLKFSDSDGNDVVWFSSRKPDSLGIPLGQPCTIKATVKRHEEYRGSKQTIVTRGRLIAA